jgi:hypothetical protein
MPSATREPSQAAEPGLYGPERVSDPASFAIVFLAWSLDT